MDLTQSHTGSAAESHSRSGHGPAKSTSQTSAPPVPESYEETHVHAVYEAIAPHFSATRHKPWPLVTTFLHAQAPGSIGLDVGCGNGKYLPVAADASLQLLGSDRSPALVRLARSERGGEVLVADGLALPYRPGAADFAISVAVLHHLSTQERRRAGIGALLACVKPAGKVFVYVWALEQGESRRGWDEGDAQDTLVPWVKRTKGKAESETYQRYYHLYRKGELEEDVVAAGGVVLEAGYEKDNWWVICSRQS